MQWVLELFQVLAKLDAETQHLMVFLLFAWLFLRFGAKALKAIKKTNCHPRKKCNRTAQEERHGPSD